MRAASRIALVAQSAACAGAFVATSPGWSGTETPRVAVAQRPAPVPVAAIAPPASAQSTSIGTAGAFLAGTIATVALLLRSQYRRDRNSKITRGSWTRYDAIPGMEIGDGSRGPDYRSWINLRRQAKYANGRKLKRWKQQQILKESGIECAKEGFTKWYPGRDRHNLYKGPESHPDNPWFPAPGPGYGQPRALLGWAPAPLTASASKSSGSSTFTGSGAATFGRSAKHPGRVGNRSSGSALVLHAHKKAAGSTKNQGSGNTNAHYWGINKKGYQGNAVKAGQTLLKQKGQVWYAGANVQRGKDYTLNALRDGIVQWRGTWKHREVFVVPWEYVRKKCVWTNANTLGPKVYEPWMNTHNRGKRHYIHMIRNKWLESEEGKAWTEKKEKKKEDQKAIQMRIRAHRKLRKVNKVRAGGEGVSVDSGSEAEN